MPTATFEDRVAAAEAAMGPSVDRPEVERFVHLYMSQRALDVTEAPTPTSQPIATLNPSVVFGDMFEGDLADPEFVRIYGELKAWYEARKLVEAKE